jgi:hypothetical protein
MSRDSLWLSLAVGPRLSRPMPFVLLLGALALLAVGAFLLPGEWQIADIAVLIFVVLIMIVRGVMLLSAYAGPTGRRLRGVRSMRGSSLVFTSLLSTQVIASLAVFGVVGSVMQVWMAVAIGPSGIELWFSPEDGTPAYTIAWGSILAVRGGTEMLGARYRNDADLARSVEITVAGPNGPVDFALGIFDDRENPANRDLVRQVATAMRPFLPARS